MGVFILIERPMLRALRRGRPLWRLDFLKPIVILEGPNPVILPDGLFSDLPV
jgi:hypothetical protein